MDLFQLLSSPDVNWWTGVVWITCGLLWCFYQLFGLSFWRHPFTAEHPLLRQWCSDTFLQSDEESHLSGMAWGQTFIFGWTNVKLCWMQFSPEKRNQNSVSTLVLLRYDINDSHNSVLVLSSTIGYFLFKTHPYAGTDQAE